MTATPILAEHFYHDGRGPELQRVHWRLSYPVAFDFYNPDDIYDESSLKHILLKRVEAYSMASEEVHGAILASASCNAAIFRVEDSKWLRSLNQRHLARTNHYQIIFYDEVFDVVCEAVSCETGGYSPDAV